MASCCIADLKWPRRARSGIGSTCMHACGRLQLQEIRSQTNKTKQKQNKKGGQRRPTSVNSDQNREVSPSINVMSLRKLHEAMHAHPLPEFNARQCFRANSYCKKPGNKQKKREKLGVFFLAGPLHGFICLCECKQQPAACNFCSAAALVSHEAA
jgi:hypothetical protein